MESEQKNINSEAVLIGLGQKIKALRLERNWTQEKFAEMARINDKEVSHIEAGRRNITIDTLVKIANSFNTLPYILLRESTD